MPEVVSLEEAIASNRAVAAWLMNLPDDARIMDNDGETVVIERAKRAGKILYTTLFTMGIA